MIISCNQSPKQSATTETDTTKVSLQDSARDGIFIHITESYNHPHRVLMPLKMANMMAEDKDVYACSTSLKIAGFKPEDLMEGFQVAQKDKIY